MKYRERVLNLVKYVSEDIWNPMTEITSPMLKVLVIPVRVTAVAIKGFIEDKVGMKASALTYYSLWAVVPSLALMLGLARGFGFHDILEKILYDSFKGQPQIVDSILNFTYKYLETTKQGMIVGIGVIILLWSVMNMLGQIEKIFNEIWEVKKGRSIYRKYTDYFSFFILIPLFLLLSTGANIFLHGQVGHLFSNIGLDFIAEPAIQFFGNLIPVVLSWIMLSMLYSIMPNTRVKFPAAAISGIITGSIFQIWQLIYIAIQTELSRLNAVYGSFAAFPLFLFWLQTSWVLILFGAELAFAVQNSKNFLYHTQLKRVSHSYYRLIALYVCSLIYGRFNSGEVSLDSEKIAETNNLPMRMVSKVLSDLVDAGLVHEIRNDDSNDISYLPAIAPEKVTIQFVNEQLDNFGYSDFLPQSSVEFEKIRTIKAQFDANSEVLEANIKIADLY